MKDPYEILGVSHDASLDQVKESYRALAKKYHPDNYADSPLKDLAEEKMSEVNAAYDTVISDIKRRGQTQGGNQGFYQQNGYQYQQSYADSSLSDVRRMLSQGLVSQAEELLEGIPLQRRDAEWYYLRGMVYYRRGWFDDALNHFNTACNLNPTNVEYRQAYAQASRYSNTNYGNIYRQNNMRHSSGDCDFCDICSALLCADCCCECMGGDLIPCC
jgi:curved DNA-binding protein CbpA